MNNNRDNTTHPDESIVTDTFGVEWEPKSSICTNKLAFFGIFLYQYIENDNENVVL